MAKKSSFFWCSRSNDQNTPWRQRPWNSQDVIATVSQYYHGNKKLRSNPSLLVPRILFLKSQWLQFVFTFDRKDTAIVFNNLHNESAELSSTHIHSSICILSLSLSPSQLFFCILSHCHPFHMPFPSHSSPVVRTWGRCHSQNDPALWCCYWGQGGPEHQGPSPRLRSLRSPRCSPPDTWLRHQCLCSP